MCSKNGKVMITNNSFNGTFINGVAVDKGTIFPGDIVSILQDDFEIFELVF